MVWHDTYVSTDFMQVQNAALHKIFQSNCSPFRIILIDKNKENLAEHKDCSYGFSSQHWSKTYSDWNISFTPLWNNEITLNGLPEKVTTDFFHLETKPIEPGKRMLKFNNGLSQKSTRGHWSMPSGGFLEKSTVEFSYFLARLHQFAS